MSLFKRFDSVQRIEKADSQSFTKVSVTSTDSPVLYYTMEEGEDGWDNITYYKKLPEIGFNENMSKERVYVMSNPCMPGILKIGKTKDESEIRAKQLSSSTGIPLPFKVEYIFECYNSYGLEQEIHERLKSHRVTGNREFFTASLNESIKVIEELGVRYNPHPGSWSVTVFSYYVTV